MAKNKVTFQEGDILVNGVKVGDMSSGSEVWISLFSNAAEVAANPTQVLPKREFAGRFKYFKPRTRAKHFIKWALENFSNAEIIAVAKGGGPLNWAELNGYVPYGLTKAA